MVSNVSRVLESRPEKIYITRLTECLLFYIVYRNCFIMCVQVIVAFASEIFRTLFFAISKLMMTDIINQIEIL